LNSVLQYRARVQGCWHDLDNCRESELHLPRRLPPARWILKQVISRWRNLAPVFTADRSWSSADFRSSRGTPPHLDTACWAD